MLSRSTSFVIALSTGLAAGLGSPYIELALACRVPASEACVWGKAFFPLTRWVSLILIGGVGTGLVYAVLRWRCKPKGNDEQKS